MSIQNALASVAVKDLKRATEWYEKVLDAPPSHPMPELYEWQFQGGGGLQVYELAERAGSCSATLAVDDLDAQIARLQKLNVQVNKLPANPRVRVIMLKDPEGNSIAMAQALDPKLAQ